MKTPSLLLLVLALAISTAHAQVTQQWVARHASPTPYNDRPYAMTVDATGHVLVTGSAATTSGGNDWATIKYNPAGSMVWLRTLDGGGSDAAAAIRTDAAGNVYITGSSAGGFYSMTAKYNAAGDRLWVQSFTTTGEGDAGVDLALDADGNVYVTGYNVETATSYDIITIKYSPGGAELWVRRYDFANGEDVPAAIASDASGLYVTGRSGGAFTTLKYDFDGVLQWVRNYSGGQGSDAAADLAVDGAGNVYVTGQSAGAGTNADYATIKYDAAGTQQWVRRYDGPSTTFANDYDRPAALALDASGNVFVTGNSSDDYATVKYDPAGNEMWVRRFGAAGAADWATAIAVDASGNSHVTGSSYGNSTTQYDFLTLSYDPSGALRWTQRYNGPANAYDTPSAIAVHAGNVHVTGSSPGIGTSSDYATIQYAPATTSVPPTALTFTPPHDAWVRSSSPSSNFGARPELRLRGGSQVHRSYLKFDVSGVTGAIQSATLRLRVIDAGPDGGSVFAVSNNLAGTATPWTESALTWNNAPAPSGSALDAAGSVSLNTWVELDVTPAISGNGTFSFALTTGSNNVVDYSSAEGANPPQLVVVVAGSTAQPSVNFPSGEPTLGRAGIVLHANRPNPFLGGTTIPYALPQSMPVRLAIYDIAGREVRSLVDGLEDAGERHVTWDGRDQYGARVRAGLYLYRLEAGATRLTRKLSVLE